MTGIDDLRIIAEFFGGHGVHATEGIAAAHGTEHTGAKATREQIEATVGYGRLKDCFQNAFTVAAFDHDYTYVEGVAIRHETGVWVHHAWLLDKDGTLVDRTWRDGGTECGLCFDGKIEFDRCVVCEGDIDRCGHDRDEDGCFEGEEEDCRFCRGTGDCAYGHHKPIANTTYIGIAIPRDRLVEVVMAKGTYGVLDDEGFVEDLEAGLLTA